MLSDSPRPKKSTTKLKPLSLIHILEGKEVSLLIVTDGSSSQYRNADDLDEIIVEKKKETENAAKILGISRVLYGGLPDMRLDVTPHIDINLSLIHI